LQIGKYEEDFENTKRVITICKLKVGKHNSQKKKKQNKKTNNNLQILHRKLKIDQSLIRFIAVNV